MLLAENSDTGFIAAEETDEIGDLGHCFNSLHK